MKRSTLLLATLALVVATGCPDTRTSRSTQTVNELAALSAELKGVEARVDALEGRKDPSLRDIEARIERLEQRPVNVYVSGGTGELKPFEGKQPGPLPAATDPTPERTPGPTPVATPAEGTSTVEAAGKFDEENRLRPRVPGEKPNYGGRVRLRFTSQPDKLNTHLDNSAVTSYITGYINETLIEQNPVTFAWEPLLAERWETEDMLFEISGTEPITGVEFVASRQKWVRNEEDGTEQSWWPWQIAATPAGFEIRTLTEHVGKVTQRGDSYEVKAKDGSIKTLPNAKVAGVNYETVFTFHLRPNATWHDGKPVTADDVVFSLAYVKCEYVDAPSIRAYYEDVRPAEKLGPLSVRIIYSKQYFQALEFAGGIAVHPKHVFDPDNLLRNDPKAFGDYFNKHPKHREPVGSGPYKYKSWKQGESVTLTRNLNYHSPKKGGYLDELTWRFIPETQAGLAAMRAGDVDFVPEMSATQYFDETLGEFERNYVKPSYYYGNYGYIGWNMRRPPFNDPKVRRAMAHGALDVQEFLRTVLHNSGSQVAGSQYIKGDMYDHSIKPFEYSPDKAQKLLREAGWFDRDGDGVIENADGMPFQFEMLMPQGSATNTQMMAIVQQNLDKLGIKMQIRLLEWAVFIDNIKSRAFDACRLGWGQSIESDPFQLWHSSGSENQGSNHTGFVSAEADELILQIRKTLDKNERRKLHFRFQKLLYETQPYLFLYCSPALGAYNPRFHGVRFLPVRPGYDLREWYDIDANK